MQDFVPLGTGNSRLMKSNIPAGTTWEQAIAMLNSGTFPYDTGQLNSPGISLPGTPLNKQTLLQDATAALFGLTNTATVDAILQLLAKAAVVNSAGDALETVLGGTLLTIPGVQIATGSYVGTGKYGSSNPNSLTFGFEPKLVIIQEENAGARDKGNLHTGNVWVSESTYGTVYYYSGSTQITNQYNTLTWGSNTLSWYSSDSESSQLNFSNTNYNYIAIG